MPIVYPYDDLGVTSKTWERGREISTPCSFVKVVAYGWHPRRTSFLLLARYVPNLAKRSIWDQCKYVYIEI